MSFDEKNHWFTKDERGYDVYFQRPMFFRKKRYADIQFEEDEEQDGGVKMEEKFDRAQK